MRFLFSGMANASFKLPICKAVEYPMRDLKSDSIKRREAIKLENVSLSCDENAAKNEHIVFSDSSQNVSISSFNLFQRSAIVSVDM